jgi:hypothetical protein
MGRGIRDLITKNVFQRQISQVVSDDFVIFCHSE